MASGKLKEVRGRIASVISTQQITKAMKMVAAAKLRKAQDKIIAMRPYSNKLDAIMHNLMHNSTGDVQIPYTENRAIKHVLLVSITSNRGLCGGFNSAVIKKVNSLIKDKYSDYTVTVLCIGKKAEDYFKKTDYFIKGTTLPRNLGQLYDNLTYEAAAEVCESIMKAYDGRQFEVVDLVYNQFKNATTQVLTTETLLPVGESQLAAEAGEGGDEVANYIFEPSEDEILNDMIPISIKTSFFSALLDSNAAEHGARMTAMDQATENAKEMLQDLRISYNRARQADITTELTEIVSGANALTDG